jgi:DNA-directed RNA polymerase specialized sigma subunit
LGLAVKSQAEVAQILGVSIQAVSKVERKALKKLRRALWLHRLEFNGY